MNPGGEPCISCAKQALCTAPGWAVRWHRDLHFSWAESTELSAGRAEVQASLQPAAWMTTQFDSVKSFVIWQLHVTGMNFFRTFLKNLQIKTLH